MKVSIIIPTNNRKDLLRKTLSNIFTQTLKPFEVIVVDDHSTDGTAEAISTEFGSSVKVILNVGKGPGAARNTGFQESKGDYIKFFDSDDLMTPNTLKCQYEHLKNSNRQFIYSSYVRAYQGAKGEWLPSDNIVMHYYPFHTTQPLWRVMIESGLFIAIPSMLFRKSLLLAAGPWREDATAYEDWDYLFRISLQEPFPEHTNECAFIYRMHGTQTTIANMSDEQRDLDKYNILNKLNDFIVNNEKFTVSDRVFFRNKLYQLYKATPSMKLKSKLKHHDTILNKLISEYMRLRFRIGRFKTNTVWQPAHGPLMSEQKVAEYIAQIEK